MWTYVKTSIKEERIDQYQILKEDNIISFRTFFELLKNDPTFRDFYKNLLQQSSFQAFFWEHPAISLDNLDQAYEFVLYKSTSLIRLKANPMAFQDYFSEHESIVDFPNLRGDAHLIVPSPIVEDLTYPHLAQFIRNAPSVQVDALLKRVGELLMEKVDSRDKWLSTAGLGVSWLHIRLDSRPKYYRYQAYK